MGQATREPQDGSQGDNGAARAKARARGAEDEEFEEAFWGC